MTDPLIALREADLLHDAEAVEAAYDRLAAEISPKLEGSDPLVLCVMIGGIVPTVEILRRLHYPYELDYVHATRYRGETSGKDVIWKVSPSARVEGRTVLIIDDILDEGHTLATIQAAVRAQQPKVLYTAVLVEKEHARRNPETTAEFVGLRVPDRYVFGGGMDYKNYLRFAPGIYAVKEM